MPKDGFPERKYRIYARLSIFKKRLKRAKKVIDEAMSCCDSWYIACSGGKDSVALAHLVNEQYPYVPVWSEKDDCDFPGEEEYITHLADKYNWDLTIERPPVSLWEEAKKISLCSDIHSRDSIFSSKWFYKMVDAQEKKYKGVFIGLRKEESRARLMNYACRGHLYQKKNGKYVCNPLSTWTADDTFAYLICNDIPIFEIYSKTLFHDGDPGRIRKAWFLPGQAARKGQAAWLKYYYPEIFNKLVEIDPQVGQHT